MKRRLANRTRQSGFTLLEVIITMIVASILGAILVQFMGTSMHQSFQPVQMVQDGYGLGEIMEKVNAEYKRLLLTSNDPLTDLLNAIDTGNVLPTPRFGIYTYNSWWIDFDNNGIEFDIPAPTPEQKRVLKVEFTHGSQRMTAMFTQ